MLKKMVVTVMPLQYVKIPYQLLKYKGFDNKGADMTKYVYVAILKHRQGDNNKVTVNMTVLEKITGITRTNITLHINRLIEHNFIDRSHQVYGWDEFGINTYTLNCPEEKFSMIPYAIAYDMEIDKKDVIAYANIKRIMDLRRTDKKVFATKEELTEAFQCSENNVDKIKRRLKEIGLINFERKSKAIELTWELDNFSEVKRIKYNRKQHVEKTVKSKNGKEVKANENANIV